MRRRLASFGFFGSPLNFSAWMIGSLLVVGLLVGISPSWFASVAHADDASVLPKGRSNVSLENLFFFSTGQRFNRNGSEEEIAGAFNNRRLDSSVFPGLLPSGQNIGTAFVKFRYDFNILDFTYSYGITDRLTAGIDIPYYHAQSRVKASVNSSGATLGIGATGAFVPIALAVRPVNTEDVQQLLNSRFGFKRVRDFDADGLGDITAGFKYQYLRTEDFRLAATLGARFPTGRQDDPDDLSDVPWSPGNYAVLVRLHHDWVVSNLWNKPPAGVSGSSAAPRTGDLVFDFTFRYDWNLPTDVTVRVADPSNPITTNRERVSRDFGDRFEFEFAGKYQIFRGLSFSTLYKSGFKVEDRITGHMGFPTNLLEKHTDSNEQLYIVRLTYSTLPLYLEKKFPLPMSITVAYRDRFAGRGTSNAASPSQVLKTQYISFGLSILF